MTTVASDTSAIAVANLPFVRVDEGRIQEHVDEVVRRTVEETLNGLLDAEAEQLCGAKLYERNEARRDSRAGHYKRKLHTKAGEVELKVPKLRTLPFETGIIERYRRRESSVEEALVARARSAS
jgi:putative transposase